MLINRTLESLLVEGETFCSACMAVAFVCGTAGHFILLPFKEETISEENLFLWKQYLIYSRSIVLRVKLMEDVVQMPSCFIITNRRNSKMGCCLAWEVHTLKEESTQGEFECTSFQDIQFDAFH